MRIDGELRSFSFTARQLPDGTVDGQAELQARQADHWVHLRLDCLVLDGTTAHLSGVVTQSSISGLVGLVGVFSVADAGERAGVGPDRISSLEPTAGNCRSDQRAPEHRVEHGNIQVG